MKAAIVKRIFFALSLGLAMFLFIFSSVGCNKQEEKEIQLTPEQSKIADIIYDFRNVWENDNIGRSCTSFWIRRIKGKVILTCGYYVGDGASMADSYTIYPEANKLEPSKIGDTGYGADVGLVVGIHNYNCHATEDSKKATIKALVYGLD